MKGNEVNKKDEKVKFNISNIVSIATFIGAVIVLIQKLTEYIRWSASAVVYGTEISLYQYSETNLFYNLLIIVVYIITALPLGMYIEKLRLNFSRKESFIKNKKTRLNIMYISLFGLFFSSFITVLDGVGYTIMEIFAYIFMKFLLLLLVSILIAYSAKCIGDESMEVSVFKKSRIIEETLEFVIKIITGTCVTLVVIMLVIWTCSYCSLKVKTKYYVVDDNKAVVYISPTYYIVLDCEINDGNIILYKGKQTKIDTINTHTVLHKFEKIDFK